MNKSFQRTNSERREVVELRIAQPPPIPERVVRAFPELGRFNDDSGEWGRKMNEQVRQAIEDGREVASDYVAIFEAALA